MSTLENELRSLIARIEAVQKERNLSDTKLVTEFPQLGSQKTWADRLRAGRFEELNLPRWHKRLQAVATILDGGSPDDDYFPELPFAREMLSRLLKLEKALSDRRILACLAANGCGKTFFTRWALNQSRSTRVAVRVRPTWKNRPVHLCAGLLRALGEEPKHASPAAAEDAVIRLLTATPRTVFLDQAHEGGVALLHLLRALVDETPSRFVYLAYDTAWRQVLQATTDSAIEASAFMGRCVKPVFNRYARGTQSEDVAFYLREVASLGEGAAKSLAALLTPALQSHMNLRLLDDAVAAARWASGRDNPPPAAIQSAVAELCGLDPKAFAPAAEEGV